MLKVLIFKHPCKYKYNMYTVQVYFIALLLYTGEYAINIQQHTVDLLEMPTGLLTEVPLPHMPVDFFGWEGAGAVGEFIQVTRIIYITLCLTDQSVLINNILPITVQRLTLLSQIVALIILE